jgi:Kdo2-lipid IVA lauroyltransferase/acyltransferase
MADSWRALRRNWITDPLDGIWKTALHHSMRVLPIPVCSSLGAWLGRLLGPTVHRSADERARRNYLHLRPDTSPEQLARIMRQMWSNVGRSMAELSVIERLWKSGRIEVTGSEHVRGPQLAGRPVVVACLHLANWELTGIGLVNIGYEGCSVFQPYGRRADVRLAAAARRRLTTRNPVYPPGVASARAIYRTLVRDRLGVHLHIDEPFKGRIETPSFGRARPVRGNIANAVRLALAADAVLVPAYAERLGDRARFRLIYEPAFPLQRSGNRDADIRVNVERLDAHVSHIVGPRLAQWLMLHERLFDE